MYSNKSVPFIVIIVFQIINLSKLNSNCPFLILHGTILVFLLDKIWAGLTWSMILLPGLGCGIYEILRAPISHLELRSSLSGTSSRSNKNKQSRGFLSFSHLSLGLDVLPEFHWKIYDNLCIKLLVIPFYLMFMALFFPFLPLIQ
jgi:hypothetical protein